MNLVHMSVIQLYSEESSHPFMWFNTSPQDCTGRNWCCEGCAKPNDYP